MTHLPQFSQKYPRFGQTCATGFWPVVIAVIVVMLIWSTGSILLEPVALLFAVPIGICATWVCVKYPRMAILLLIAFIPLDMFTVVPGQESSKLSLTKFLAPTAFLGTILQRGKLERKVMDPVDKMFAVFTIYCFALFPFSPFKGAAIVFVQKMVSMLMLYYLIIFWGDRDPKFMRNLVWVLILSTAASSLFGFFSILHNGNPFSEFQDDSMVRVTGASGISPNDYAYILFLPLALAGGAVLSKLPAKWRMAAFCCCGGIASSLLFTYSRSAIVTFGLAGLILLWFLRKKLDARLFLLLPIIIVAGILFMPESVKDRMGTLIRSLTGEYQEISLDRRANYLRVGANILEEHPLMGGGLGSFPILHADPKYQTVPALYGLARMPHNVYLQVVTETGIIGLCLFLLPILYLFVRMKRSLNKPETLALALLYAAAMLGLLSSMIMGLFLHLLYNKSFWITLAFCRVLVRNDDDPSCYRTFEHRW